VQLFGGDLAARRYPSITPRRVQAARMRPTLVDHVNFEVLMSNDAHAADALLVNAIHCTNERLRLWDYTISHGMLLYRCPAQDASPGGNVDLIFADVGYIDAPTTLGGVSIAEASRNDAEAFFAHRVRPRHGDNLFWLLSGRSRYAIVAGAWALERNTRELFDSGVRPNAPPAASNVLLRSGETDPPAG
jgi:hypothetical protein